MFAQSSNAAPCYEGKVLKIVVGHAVGGGYDRLARLIGKHLSRYIPGSPRIIVENMPGAQTMIAANYLYSIAKPDGLTIGSLDRGIPFSGEEALKTMQYLAAQPEDIAKAFSEYVKF